MRRAACGTALMLAALTAGCGTPETQCRDGVKELKQRTETLVGFDQPAEVKRALENVNSAENQLATGNYAGCLESIDEARRYLRSSQRTNQQ
jgi:hypothetical protein